MSGKALLTFAFILFYQITFSQRITSRGEYIQIYRTLAVMEMQRTGVPASITLAQACLESNNGNSELSRRSNNHFGIKCKNTWTGKVVYYDDDERNECFRRYNSVEESYIDHSNFLSANPRYSDLFMLDITDYKGWARGLKKDGYATNPRYAEHLIRIIEEYRLYMYDQILDQQQLAGLRKKSSVDSRNLINPYQVRKVVLRNGLKSIVVKAGDTTEAIAQEFNLKSWQIENYNDYPKGRQPVENEIIYLERKKNRADKGQETHVFENDDSMHYISQLYGIKLKQLYRRNRMDFGEKPEPGTVIYLRHKKPR